MLVNQVGEAMRVDGERMLDSPEAHPLMKKGNRTVSGLQNPAGLSVATKEGLSNSKCGTICRGSPNSWRFVSHSAEASWRVEASNLIVGGGALQACPALDHIAIRNIEIHAEDKGRPRAPSSRAKTPTMSSAIVTSRCEVTP